MKILYITNGTNGSGGLERVLSIKASYFAENNYQVSILVLNNAHENSFYEFSNKINFYSIDVKGHPILYLKLYANGIRKTVKSLQPDIISICDDALKAFLIPQFLKTDSKIIYERHVSKLIELKVGYNVFQKIYTKIKWFLMEKLAGKFSKFVVLTEGNKKEWKLLNNIAVIPNSLSFYPDTSSNLNNKIVICVGKISYQKGQDLLIKAWKDVYKKHPDWQLHLYGKEDINFLDANNLSHNIFYFPSTKDIEQKYLQSSVCVMSSRFEGFGMVLIEAMACGVPCVSFNCDHGPSEIIRNNKDGFIVEKENIYELAEKINILIENKDLRKKMGKYAKENVLRFSPKIVVAKWDQLFKLLKS